MIDSTTIRAHQDSSRGKGVFGDQCLGRSRGGLGTKIHMLVDQCGAIVKFILSGGHCHDLPLAESLLDVPLGSHLLADRGYDCDDLRSTLMDSGVTPVIPYRKNRRNIVEYDTDLYKLRNIVERKFCALKKYRRIHTRYEKTATCFGSMIALVALIIHIKL